MGTRTEAVCGGTKANDILLRDFTSPFRSGYVRVHPDYEDGAQRSRKGYLIPQYYCDHEKRIEEMEIRPDDLWVASYPKTGTTWTQEMVWCIGNDLDFERAKSVVLPLRFPFVEISCLFNTYDTPPNKDTDGPLQDFLRDSVGYTSKMDSPRFIKTHLPWDLLPKQIKEKNTKIIYVGRNPKDTCVSYFHHAQLIEGYKGNLEDFVELFLEDTLAYSPFWDHLISYWEHRNDPNVLFLTFEQMKRDLPSVVEKVVSFMEREPLSETDMKKLCDHLSFDSMKSNKSVNYEYVIDKDRASALPENSRNFIRKGKVNGWKEEISPELAKRFDEWTEKNLNGLNVFAADCMDHWTKDSCMTPQFMSDDHEENVIQLSGARKTATLSIPDQLINDRNIKNQPEFQR